MARRRTTPEALIETYALAYEREVATKWARDHAFTKILTNPIREPKFLHPTLWDVWTEALRAKGQALEALRKHCAKARTPNPVILALVQAWDAEVKAGEALAAINRRLAQVTPATRAHALTNILRRPEYVAAHEAAKEAHARAELALVEACSRQRAPRTTPPFAESTPS